MELESIRIVQKNRTNEVYVCREISNGNNLLYTVISIKDKTIAKEYLKIFSDIKADSEKPYIDSFSYEGDFVMVFPYKNERPLESFYMGGSTSISDSEEICVNLILECLTTTLPYPFLYLILKQRRLNLSKDRSVYFDYNIDLAELDSQIEESDCAVQASAILLWILENKASQKPTSYELLKKKNEKQAYNKFSELYKDICITQTRKTKTGLWASIRRWFIENSDRLFRVLLVICLIMGVLVVVSIFSQVVWGDIPWLRVFINTFKYIGKESMIK